MLLFYNASETRVLEKVILCHLFPKQCFFAKNFQKLWYWAILAYNKHHNYSAKTFGKRLFWSLKSRFDSSLSILIFWNNGELCPQRI